MGESLRDPEMEPLEDPLRKVMANKGRTGGRQGRVWLMGSISTEKAA
jgi:hypothetical protein